MIMAIIGGTSLSLLPIVLELAVELTRNADGSSAILWLSYVPRPRLSASPRLVPLRSRRDSYEALRRCIVDEFEGRTSSRAGVVGRGRLPRMGVGATDNRISQ